jgi:uncharacterized membrane protein YesL
MTFKILPDDLRDNAAFKSDFLRHEKLGLRLCIGLGRLFYDLMSDVPTNDSFVAIKSPQISVVLFFPIAQGQYLGKFLFIGPLRQPDPAE